MSTMNSRRLRPMAKRPTLNESNYDPVTASRNERLERLRLKDKRGKGMRLESLRTSPYMFFHGESEEYSEAAFEREQKLLAMMKQQHAASGKGEKTTFGHVPVRSPGLSDAAPSPILHDNIYDDLNADAFAQGHVIETAQRLRRRIEERKEAAGNGAGIPQLRDDDSVPENLVLIRKALLRCVADDNSAAVSSKPSGAGWSFNNTDPADAAEGGDARLSVAKLKAELRDNFEVTSEKLIDHFARGVAGRGPTRPGVPETISFAETYAVLEKFVAGKQHSKATARACFALFDSKQCGTISTGTLRALRGKPESAMPSGVTFPMLKGMFDLCLRDPANPMPTITFDEFLPVFRESDTLVAAFIEEIIRVVLQERFEHDRASILRMK